MKIFVLPAVVMLLFITGCATSKTKEFTSSYPTAGEKAFERAESELRKGNLERATRRFKTVLAIYQKLDGRKAIAKTYNRLGTIALLQNDLPKASSYIDNAKLTAEIEGYDDILFRSKLNKISLLLVKRRLEDAKNIADSMTNPKDENERSELDNITALILMQDDKNEEAEKKFFDAVKNGKTEQLKSTAYSNLGSLYLKTGEPDKALLYLKKALAIDKKLEMPLLTGQNLHLIGKVYEQKADYKNALYHYNRALHLNIQLRLK